MPPGGIGVEVVGWTVGGFRGVVGSVGLGGSSAPAARRMAISVRIRPKAVRASVGRLMNPKTRNQMSVHGVVAEQAPESSEGNHSSTTW